MDGVEEGSATNLPRSKSAHALKTVGEGQDEHMTALSQLLWIAVSLLESDYEHEFLLALRLLEKVWILIMLDFSTEQTFHFSLSIYLRRNDRI